MTDGSTQQPTALITGAAAGIGAAFSRMLVREGYRLVLVDRNGFGLQEMADSLGGECETVTADLTVEEDVSRIEKRCREGVDLLVNNAGFGHSTKFLATSVEAEVAMSRLHVETVLRLTLAALPSMIERGHGGVINVGSVLGFFPSSTYSASKAWVINFSQSAARTARPHGVAVMALCPGFTRTEFHKSAEMNMTEVPGFLWLDADVLVAKALRDWRKRKALSIPGWKNKTIASIGKMLPLGVIDKMLSRSKTRALAELLTGTCTIRRSREESTHVGTQRL
jgi:short-subunit dehydrogenase